LFDDDQSSACTAEAAEDYRRPIAPDTDGPKSASFFSHELTPNNDSESNRHWPPGHRKRSFPAAAAGQEGDDASGPYAHAQNMISPNMSIDDNINLGGGSPDRKRVCIEANLIDLNALSLVGDQDTSPTKITANDDRPTASFPYGAPPTSRLAALKNSTYHAKIQSTSSSSTGTPQSVGASCSSLGSLFGRPSRRFAEPWMTWSSTSPAPDSLKSLHPLGMPAPMLGSIDEELLLSRAGNDLDGNRHRDGQLHCPYEQCDWATGKEQGDPWDRRRRHFDQEHERELGPGVLFPYMQQR
jgi:hypothetical protein